MVLLRREICREARGGARTSKMLRRSNMGLHVWLMTSRQTVPDISSTFGWKSRLQKPIDGDLYG